MNKYIDYFYNKIRFLFVDGIDPNEDFYCIICHKPVVSRVLTCSIKCSKVAIKEYGF